MFLKKIASFALAIIFTSLIHGQDLINVKDLDTSVNGNLLITHPTKRSRQIKYTVVDNKVDGTVIVQTKNGKKVLSYDMVKGVYSGKIKVYNLRERATIIQTTRNDSLISEYANYVRSDGSTYKEWNWNRYEDKHVDLLDKTYLGIVTNFWTSIGSLGRINGTIKKYYKNGQLKEIRNYVNSQKDGVWLWYNKDGSVKKKRIFNFRNQ
jgi:antitoxin component YwqK of YwqJK toxin-antitoxin module